MTFMASTSKELDITLGRRTITDVTCMNDKISKLRRRLLPSCSVAQGALSRELPRGGAYVAYLFPLFGMEGRTGPV